MAGSRAPVAFFACLNRPGLLTPDGAADLVLAGPDEDVATALADLADQPTWMPVDAVSVVAAVNSYAVGLFAGVVMPNSTVALPSRMALASCSVMWGSVM